MSLALNFLGALFLLDDGHARWTSLHGHHKPQAVTIGCDATISMKSMKMSRYQKLNLESPNFYNS